ncbi:uncharacterized protein JCM15063_003656 [Sporobolomyces koalae]|uniref:uncharacterized protein n=1 Tax=Sporobolomyces koalae TaxID=500713 RepID=UPI003181CF67
MNHLYHTLSPIILLTAFLVSLLAFLAPTPIFADRVSLLSVSTNVSTSSSPSRRSLSLPSTTDHEHESSRLIKRAKKPNAATAAGSARTYTLVYGPLGACHSVDSSDLACMSPTFTPIFLDLYAANTTLPASTVAILPDQFPLAPVGMFVSLLLIAFQLLAVVGSSIVAHLTKTGKAQGLAAEQPTMRKVATVAGVLGLAILLAATLSLRSELSKARDELVKAGSGTAVLGPGFSRNTSPISSGLLYRAPALRQPASPARTDSANPSPTSSHAPAPPSSTGSWITPSGPPTNSTRDFTLYHPPTPDSSGASSPNAARVSNPCRGALSSSPALALETPVLEVFGDSFAGVFTLLGPSLVKVNRFSGASGRGLGNPESTLEVGSAIVEQITRRQPRSVLLQFGAVDMHLNYLWQVKSEGPSARGPDDFVQHVFNSFQRFMLNEMVPIAKRFGVTVFVAGVTPPVVDDKNLETSAAKYFLKRTSKTPLASLTRDSHQPHDFSTRSKMVSEYNQLLSDLCARHEPLLRFVEINKYLGSRSRPGKVKSEFIDSQDPTNIHLIWETTIRFWCQELPILRPYLSTIESNSAQLARNLSLFAQEKRERVQRRTRLLGF